MIDKVANVLLNPKFVNFANNTTYTVTTESLFKATGRPVAIMMDNNVDEKTRKYAATKEGLYQLLCLGIYLTMIPLIFQKYGTFPSTYEIVGFQEFGRISKLCKISKNGEKR